MVDSNRYLTIDQQDLRGVNFSGRDLVQLEVIGSRLVGCRFDNLRVESAVFGSGGLPTELVECSFDGSRIGELWPSKSRFERCTFRNIRLREWMNGFWAELVDCLFTGRIGRAIFWGTPLSRDKDLQDLREAWDHHGRSLESEVYCKIVDRVRNEFHGNDFAGAELVDFAFRRGIDLTQQRLPTGPDYVYLPDGAAALAHARRMIETWEKPLADEAATLLQIFEEELANGQIQLLLRQEKKPRHFREVEPALYDILRGYVRRNEDSSAEPLR